MDPRRHAMAMARGRGRAPDRGFTLIELMMVILVAAVLAAIASPAMGNLIAAQRLRSASSSLQLAMVQARSEAIKRNVAVTVSPASGGWRSGWSILNPENPGGPALQVVTIPSGVEVATAATQVVFTGNGRTTLATETSFVLTAENADVTRRCVSISPTGRPSAKEGSAC